MNMLSLPTKNLLLDCIKGFLPQWAEQTQSKYTPGVKPTTLSICASFGEVQKKISNFVRYDRYLSGFFFGLLGQASTVCQLLIIFEIFSPAGKFFLVKPYSRTVEGQMCELSGFLYMNPVLNFMYLCIFHRCPWIRNPRAESCPQSAFVNRNTIKCSLSWTGCGPTSKDSATCQTDWIY